MKARVRKVAKRAFGRLGYDIVGSHFGFVPGPFIVRLLRSLSVGTVLDVGARFGDYGAWLREWGYHGEIISFEPVQSNFEILERVAARDARWSARRVALGNTTTSDQINVFHDTSLSSFRSINAYGEEQFADQASVAHTEEVAVRRLDDIFRHLRRGAAPTLFLKTDTQGNDMDVIEGAKGLIDLVAGLQVEVAIKPIYDDIPTYETVVPQLRLLGFELAGVFPVARDQQGHIIELDCVMVRRST